MLEHAPSSTVYSQRVIDSLIITSPYSSSCYHWVGYLLGEVDKRERGRQETIMRTGRSLLLGKSAVLKRIVDR